MLTDKKLAELLWVASCEYIRDTQDLWATKSFDDLSKHARGLWLALAQAARAALEAKPCP